MQISNIFYFEKEEGIFKKLNLGKWVREQGCQYTKLRLYIYVCVCVHA